MSKYYIVGFDDENKPKLVEVETRKTGEDLRQHMINRIAKENLGYATFMGASSKKRTYHSEPQYVVFWIYDFENEPRDEAEVESTKLWTFEEAFKFISDEIGQEDLYCLLDTDSRKFLKIQRIDWDDRSKAKNAKEAMEYISHYLAERWDGMDKRKANEVAKYAAEHDIPFSADLAVKFRKAFQMHQPQWNSSSAYC